MICARAFLRESTLKAIVKLDQLFKERYAKKESLLYHDLLYVQSAQQTLKESIPSGRHGSRL